MTTVPLRAPGAQDLVRAARVVGRGLIQVLSTADPPPTGWPHRAVRAANVAAVLSGLLLVSAVADLLSLHRSVVSTISDTPQLQAHAAFTGPLLAVIAVPVLLAPRYPLLGWRFAYLFALLIPTLPIEQWGQGPLPADMEYLLLPAYAGKVDWWPGQSPLIVIGLIGTLVVTFFAAGLRHSQPMIRWMWLFMMVPAWLHRAPGGLSPISLTVWLTVMAVALYGVGERRRAGQQLARHAEAADHERARRAVLQERTRIAREMHDVVAHHMSMIAVQSETAPFRLGDLSAPVRAEFLALSASAREALTDMRKLLGLLRDDRPVDLSPQPNLADLPDLVETARRAGAQVELTMAGNGIPVPTGVGVCAYRIVQEALSNAGRHAPGASVSVVVGQDAEVLRLLIVNGAGAAEAGDPRGDDDRAPTDEGREPGHGLVGMRERVALLGGSLTSGPAADGGFTVWATLPLLGANPVLREMAP